MDVGDHVAGHLAADGMTVQVEGDGGEGGAHGNAEDRHRVALQHHVHGVNSWGLKITFKKIEIPIHTVIQHRRPEENGL